MRGTIPATFNDGQLQPFERIVPQPLLVRTNIKLHVFLILTTQQIRVFLSKHGNIRKTMLYASAKEGKAWSVPRLAGLLQTILII